MPPSTWPSVWSQSPSKRLGSGFAPHPPHCGQQMSACWSLRNIRCLATPATYRATTPHRDLGEVYERKPTDLTTTMIEGPSRKVTVVVHHNVSKVRCVPSSTLGADEAVEPDILATVHYGFVKAPSRPNHLHLWKDTSRHGRHLGTQPWEPFRTPRPVVLAPTTTGVIGPAHHPIEWNVCKVLEHLLKCVGQCA